MEVEMRATSTDRAETNYELVFEYEYRELSKPYTGTDIYPETEPRRFSVTFNREAKAQTVIEDYEEGDDEEVYQSPRPLRIFRAVDSNGDWHTAHPGERLRIAWPHGDPICRARGPRPPL